MIEIAEAVRMILAARYSWRSEMLAGNEMRIRFWSLSREPIFECSIPLKEVVRHGATFVADRILGEAKAAYSRTFLEVIAG